MPIRIKPLILEMIGRYVPDFHEMSTKRKGYWFRCDSQPPYHQFVVIGSSQKERALGCDVAWGFFPTWDCAYGTHQMTASTSLPCLRLGSKAIPMEESYYEHDGTEAGIRSTLDRIGSELDTHALPWFRTRAEDAGRDRLLQHGLDWLRVHEQSISATIQDDLRQAFVQASHMAWRVELPVFDALKSELRDFAAKIGASSLHRKETAILAQHLLLYAGETKRNVA
jgi:hypothetical protein